MRAMEADLSRGVPLFSTTLMTSRFFAGKLRHALRRPQPATAEARHWRVMTAITVQNAYKVFGRRAAEPLPKLRSGATAEDVKEYGTAAVIDASFEVEDGEIFVVMGLSGSGKSTLIRMLNGLWAPTAGSSEIGGRDHRKISGAELRETRKKDIAMVFETCATIHA